MSFLELFCLTLLMVCFSRTFRWYNISRRSWVSPYFVLGAIQIYCCWFSFSKGVAYHICVVIKTGWSLWSLKWVCCRWRFEKKDIGLVILGIHLLGGNSFGSFTDTRRQKLLRDPYRPDDFSGTTLNNGQIKTRRILMSRHLVSSSWLPGFSQLVTMRLCYPRHSEWTLLMTYTSKVKMYWTCIGR